MTELGTWAKNRVRLVADVAAYLSDAAIDVLELEVAGAGVDRDVLCRLHRVSQTLRACSGLLALPLAGVLAAALESVFTRALLGEMPFDHAAVTAVEHGLDVFTSQLQHLSEASSSVIPAGFDEAAATALSPVLALLDDDALEDHVVHGPGFDTTLTLRARDIQAADAAGLHFYALKIDMENDSCLMQGGVFGMLVFLQKSGNVLDAHFAGGQDSMHGQVEVLFSSILEEDLVGAVFQMAPTQVLAVDVEAVLNGEAAWSGPGDGVIRELMSQAVASPFSLPSEGSASDDIEVLLRNYDDAMYSLRERNREPGFEPYEEDGGTISFAEQSRDTKAEHHAASLPTPISGAETCTDATGAASHGLPGTVEHGNLPHGAIRHDVVLVTPADTELAPSRIPQSDEMVATCVATGNTFTLSDAQRDATPPSPNADGMDFSGILEELESEFDLPLLEEAARYGVSGQGAGTVSSWGPSYAEDTLFQKHISEERTAELAAESSDHAAGHVELSGQDFSPVASAEESAPQGASEQYSFFDDLIRPNAGSSSVPSRGATNEPRRLSQRAGQSVESDHFAGLGEFPSFPLNARGSNACGPDARVPLRDEHAALSHDESLRNSCSTGSCGVAADIAGWHQRESLFQDERACAKSQGLARNASPFPSMLSDAGCIAGGHRLHTNGSCALLVISGEATIRQCDVLRTALLDVLARFRRVRLDLAGITGADITFIQLLRAATVSARARGVTLESAGDATPVLRALAARIGLDAEAAVREGLGELLRL